MADNLQFDHAEPNAGASSAPGTVSCTVCSTPLRETYYVANGHIVCDRCRRSVEADWNRGGAAGRLGKAIALGILATIGCSVLWYAVLKLTDSQWGILAIVVGLVVGGAVRKGSNGRGGWRYQTLAIFLTYTAVVSSYVPFIVEGLRERATQVSSATPSDSTALTKDSPLTKDSATVAAKADAIGPIGFIFGILLLLGLLYATPFLAGLGNFIGILIIGFALYEAWKLNRRVELRVSGPHQVSTSGAPA